MMGPYEAQVFAETMIKHEYEKSQIICNANCKLNVDGHCGLKSVLINDQGQCISFEAIDCGEL